MLKRWALVLVTLAGCSPKAIDPPRQGWAVTVATDHCAQNAHWDAEIPARDVQEHIWAVNTSGGPVRFEVADPVSRDLLVIAKLSGGGCPVAAMKASVGWIGDAKLDPARTWTSTPPYSGVSYCSVDLDIAPDLWDGAASNLQRHGHAGVTRYQFTPDHEHLMLRIYRNCQLRRTALENAYRQLLNLWRDDA